MDVRGLLFKILVLDVLSEFYVINYSLSLRKTNVFVHLFLRKQVNAIVYLKMKAHTIEICFAVLSKQCQLVASGIALLWDKPCRHFAIKSVRAKVLYALLDSINNRRSSKEQSCKFYLLLALNGQSCGNPVRYSSQKFRCRWVTSRVSCLGLQTNNLWMFARSSAFVVQFCYFLSLFSNVCERKSKAKRIKTHSLASSRFSQSTPPHHCNKVWRSSQSRRLRDFFVYLRQPKRHSQKNTRTVSCLRLISMRVPTDVCQQLPYRISNIESNSSNKSSQGETQSQRLSSVIWKYRTTIG